MMTIKALVVATVVACFAGSAFAGACCASKKKAAAAPQISAKKEESAKTCPTDGESTATAKKAETPGKKA